MSAPQGSFGCRITVDPSTADVLRIETKKVLMFNHDPFEDFLDYIPVKQLALAETSATTPRTSPSSWPRSTTTATASKPSTASSTPTPPRSRHRPSHFRCGV
jgi:hypothetical protein